MGIVEETSDNSVVTLMREWKASQETESYRRSDDADCLAKFVAMTSAGYVLECIADRLGFPPLTGHNDPVGSEGPEGPHGPMLSKERLEKNIKFRPTNESGLA